MRGLLRVFVLVIAGSIALMVVSSTFSFIKQNWFGKAGGKDHVAVINLTGTISASTRFVKDLKALTEKDNVKAIVVRINSPGGVVGPSQEMYEAIKAADAKIPVIASMGALAASGGYYAALGARKIYANPGTLTASIGVIMQFMNVEGLYKWARLDAYTLKAGKLKDVGSPLRRMTPEEKAYLEAMMHDIHVQFRGAVKERRKLSDEELDAVADGRVMTGSQAKTAKLVDTLGGFEDAVKEAKKLASLPDDAKVTYPTHKKGILKDVLFGQEESDPDQESLFEGLAQAIRPARGGWRVMLLAPVALD